MYLDVIPGEAHHWISTVEESVREIKGCMSKLAVAHPEITGTEAFYRAVHAVNGKDIVDGFTSLQWALGRAQDIEGMIFPATGVNLTKRLEEEGDEFQNDLARRATAEAAAINELYRSREARATHTKNRKIRVFHPGDLVYYWRKKNKGAHEAAGKKGKFFGPARVLATGTKFATADGARQEMPSGEVWLSRGGRLIVAAVTQLRLATDKEVVEHQLTNPRELPWTIVDGKQKLLPGQYEDIRAEMPDDEDFEMAARNVPGEYDERTPPPRERSRSPRGATAETGEASSSTESRPRPAPRVLEPKPEALPKRRRTKKSAPEETYEGQVFWAQQDAAVEVELDLPMPGKKRQRAIRNFETYVTSMARKKRLEVNERRLTPEERARFKVAKEKELKSYIKHNIIEALPN